MERESQTQSPPLLFHLTNLSSLYNHSTTLDFSCPPHLTTNCHLTLVSKVYSTTSKPTTRPRRRKSHNPFSPYSTASPQSQAHFLRYSTTRLVSLPAGSGSLKLYSTMLTYSTVDLWFCPYQFRLTKEVLDLWTSPAELDLKISLDLLQPTTRPLVLAINRATQLQRLYSTTGFYSTQSNS